MFSLFTGIYDSYLAPSQLNLLVIGAQGGGKTALLERLKVTKISQRPPTRLPSLTTEELTPALKEAFLTGKVSASTTATTAKASVEATPQKSNKFTASAPTPTIVVKQKRRFPLICPAPERYRKSAQDQDEISMEEEEEEEEDIVQAKDEERQPLTLPNDDPSARRVRNHSKEFSVEDIDLINDDSYDNNASMEEIPIVTVDVSKSHEPRPQEQSLNAESTFNPPLLRSSFEEFDLKANAKMLPMSKIRPTIGTNLAKLDVFGAKCHFFDVGGRMKNVWDRYYDDCDAVIFCWKLGDDPDKAPEDEDSDDDEEPFDMSKQQEILEEVRKSIADDIPFLVFGHVFGNMNAELANRMFSTDTILPHYHNPITGLCCGSAKTGVGVQNAMEWLVPLAKRQQRERLATRKEVKNL